MSLPLRAHPPRNTATNVPGPSPQPDAASLFPTTRGSSRTAGEKGPRIMPLPSPLSLTEWGYGRVGGFGAGHPGRVLSPPPAGRLYCFSPYFTLPATPQPRPSPPFNKQLTWILTASLLPDHQGPEREEGDFYDTYCVLGN